MVNWRKCQNNEVADDGVNNREEEEEGGVQLVPSYLDGTAGLHVIQHCLCGIEDEDNVFISAYNKLI